MSEGAYSQSTSESNTQGLQLKLGPFNVGGGVRIPEWFWPVVVAGIVILGVFWFKSKK